MVLSNLLVLILNLLHVLSQSLRIVHLLGGKIALWRIVITVVCPLLTLILVGSPAADDEVVLAHGNLITVLLLFEAARILLTVRLDSGCARRGADRGLGGIRIGRPNRFL